MCQGWPWRKMKAHQIRPGSPSGWAKPPLVLLTPENFQIYPCAGCGETLRAWNCQGNCPSPPRSQKWRAGRCRSGRSSQQRERPDGIWETQLRCSLQRMKNIERNSTSYIIFTRVVLAVWKTYKGWLQDSTIVRMKIVLGCSYPIISEPKSNFSI